jgi:hypothetical protein
VVVSEMVAVDPMAAVYATDAAPVTTHATDVTSAEAADVASAEAATDVASAEAATDAASAEAATDVASAEAATDVASAEAASDVTSAEAASDVTSAEATDVAAAEAADVASAEAATSTHAHQHQQTAPCIQIGFVGIARLCERCRGRESQRKSAGETKRDDVASHDCTTRGSRPTRRAHETAGRAHDALQG